MPEQVIKEKAQIQAQDELKFFLEKVRHGCHSLFQTIKECEKKEFLDISPAIHQMQQDLLEISQNTDEDI